MSFRLRLLGSAHSHFGSFASQKRYSIVFSRSPLPNNRRGRVQIPFSISKKNKTDTRSVLLFLAEKERFELSRRLYPTYTLSRGASSANLSTSPYLRIAVFQIRSTIIPHFPRFVNIFFSLFSFFRFLFALSMRFYSFFIEFLSRYSLAVSPF